MASAFLGKCASHYSGRSRGPPRRISAYEISKSTGFHEDFRFQIGSLDFKMDFWISFESLVFVILKIQLKYTHEQSMNHIPLSLDANRIQCHRHFTATQRILRV